MPKHPASKASAKEHRENSILKKIAREMKKNPPAVLAKTEKKKGKKAAEKQRVAILLSKARKAGG